MGKYGRSTGKLKSAEASSVALPISAKAHPHVSSWEAATPGSCLTWRSTNYSNFGETCGNQTARVKWSHHIESYPWYSIVGSVTKQEVSYIFIYHIAGRCFHIFSLSFLPFWYSYVHRWWPMVQLERRDTFREPNWSHDSASLHQSAKFSRLSNHSKRPLPTNTVPKVRMRQAQGLRSTHP